MASRIRIAIDCMGGDQGLGVALPAALKALTEFSDVDLVLVGDKARIDSQFEPLGALASRVSILHAPDVVSMSDKPSFALRRKPQSSMRLAVDLLQSGEVDAVVSAGNTGALMAMGCYVLKTLPGIDRPAICSALPSALGRSYLLDLGANIECSADNLHQFAIMGAALSASVDAVESPRVALLNIGEEDIKGNEQVQLAAKLLEADAQLNYIGFIEGDDLFKDVAEVIVCDGFVGNVALKVCEGTADYIADIVQQQFRENILTRLVAKLALPILKRIYQKLDPQQYNGASFLGLQGVVVKSHGNSSADSFLAAIAQARKEVSSNMLATIDQRLADLTD